MTKKKKWGLATGIRFSVYRVITVLLTIVAIAVIFRAWTQVSSNYVQTVINEFHRVSISHYLRAKEELMKSQLQIERKTGTLSENGGRHELLSQMFLAKQNLDANRVLLADFPALRFEKVFARLEGHFAEAEKALNVFLDQGKPALFLMEIDRAMIVFDQIIRLHSTEESKLTRKLEVLESRQSIVFFVLLLGLTLIGVIYTRHGLKQISMMVKEQEGIEEKIKYQAYYDSLTGLPNRHLSIDRLNQQIKEAKRDKDKVAVLFLDLDDFKKVNDSLGHDFGDKLLCEAGRRIKASLRERDTVGRLGGDEFIIVAGGLSCSGDVMPIVDKVMESLRDIFNVEGHSVVMSASVGICLYPDDGHEPSELLRKSDSAMYHSKGLGRDAFSIYTESMSRESERRVELERKINIALEQDEFHLAYQPRIDLSNNRIVGAEALLRWENPEVGNISPVEFIPVAERTGLIIQIGEFVLEESIKLLGYWVNHYDRDFQMSINVSPYQFRDSKFVHKISHQLSKTSVPGKNLELEITEGLLLAGNIQVRSALAAFDNLGLKISMDDFGTGYSSLSYLRDYPFDVVKIDRSFIKDIVKNMRDKEVVSAAIAMAHGLNLEVVAEGVEDKEQLILLRELGCDFGQGYYFGKPMPAKELSGMMGIHKHKVKLG